jgi:glycine betaine/choline ABC-type transport system substrate-binding protein
MKPSDFALVEGGARSAGEYEFKQKAFSLAALQSRYGLVFHEKNGSN